jgi:aldose 1-epimerase
MSVRGEPAGEMSTWRRLTLDRPGGLRVDLTDLGAAWLSCEVPLANGQRRQVVLGSDDPVQQLQQGAYMGATIGRYANRIAHAQVTVDGQVHHLAANERDHQLHGGPEGFDRRLWRVLREEPAAVAFGLFSADGDQGFPGAVEAVVTYEIGEAGYSLEIRFEATVSRATPLVLTNHAYLNLDEEAIDVRRHSLRLAATRFVPVDAELIPLGHTVDVDGTDFDFRSAEPIGRRLLDSPQQRLAGGYDHAWLLDDAVRAGKEPAAELRSSDGLLTARLFTDQPAVQVYTGNRLAGIAGRGNRTYASYAGVALEPGLPPDAPNRPQWPSAQLAIARPGIRYRACTRWEFVPTRAEPDAAGAPKASRGA